MSQGTRRAEFELETLEPRVLLSATPVLALAATEIDPTTTHTVVADTARLAATTEADTPLDDIFEGMSGEPLAASAATATDSAPAGDSDTAALAADQEQTNAVRPPPSSASPSNGNEAATTATGSSQVAGSPQTEHLTTTLTAANGPPLANLESRQEPILNSVPTLVFDCPSPSEEITCSNCLPVAAHSLVSFLSPRPDSEVDPQQIARTPCPSLDVAANGRPEFQPQDSNLQPAEPA